VRPFHCEDRDLVQPDGPTLEGACPVRDARDDQAWLIQVSADRSLWIDGRLGDEVVVHRVSDGAVLSVRVTTDGVLAVGPGGVFEATGAVADHVVVREPGPVRSAPITTGAEARARFERPGLVSAFFRGAPLPTPP